MRLDVAESVARFGNKAHERETLGYAACGVGAFVVYYEHFVEVFESLEHIPEVFLGVICMYNRCNHILLFFRP